ncbi:MAG: hypothetical protein U9Q40_10700 [Campylobacterota bacterium]|nr:hypothetical protein [Campylobacterota bacterium]
MKFYTLALLTISLLLLSACGYKPSAKYSREVVGESISTSVVISAEDPENTVIIKDAVDSAVIEVFHASLTSRNYSQTHLHLRISSPRYTPIQYDANGYVIAYRATIRLGIVRETNGQRKNYTTVGNYDFSVVPNAVLTDQERFDAIKFSSQKAISAFVAKVSAEGTIKED